MTKVTFVTNVTFEIPAKVLCWNKRTANRLSDTVQTLIKTRLPLDRQGEFETRHNNNLKIICTLAQYSEFAAALSTAFPTVPMPWLSQVFSYNPEKTTGLQTFNTFDYNSPGYFERADHKELNLVRMKIPNGYHSELSDEARCFMRGILKPIFGYVEYPNDAFYVVCRSEQFASFMIKMKEYKTLSTKLLEPEVLALDKYLETLKRKEALDDRTFTFGVGYEDDDDVQD